MIMNSPASSNFTTEMASIFNKKCESMESKIDTLYTKIDNLNKEIVTEAIHMRIQQVMQVSFILGVEKIMVYPKGFCYFLRIQLIILILYG